MGIDSNKNVDNHNKLSLSERFKSGAAGAGLSTLAVGPELATGLGVAGLYTKGKDIFIKNEKKILPTVKKVMVRNPSLALLLAMGTGLSIFLEYSSYKLMNKAVTGRRDGKVPKSTKHSKNKDKATD